MFSQRRCWGLSSSGIWRNATGLVALGVSNQRGVFVFCGKIGILDPWWQRQFRPSKLSGISNSSTQRYIPEDPNPQRRDKFSWEWGGETSARLTGKFWDREKMAMACFKVLSFFSLKSQGNQDESMKYMSCPIEESDCVTHNGKKKNVWGPSLCLSGKITTYKNCKSQ